MTRALVKPHGGNSPTKQGDYVTTCKVCHQGVFSQQPRVWLTTPMGLSHEACAALAGLASSDV